MNMEIARTGKAQYLHPNLVYVHVGDGTRHEFVLEVDDVTHEREQLEALAAASNGRVWIHDFAKELEVVQQCYGPDLREVMPKDREDIRIHWDEERVAGTLATGMDYVTPDRAVEAVKFIVAGAKFCTAAKEIEAIADELAQLQATFAPEVAATPQKGKVERSSYFVHLIGDDERAGQNRRCAVLACRLSAKEVAKIRPLAAALGEYATMRALDEEMAWIREGFDPEVAPEPTHDDIVGWWTPGIVNGVLDEVTATELAFYLGRWHQRVLPMMPLFSVSDAISPPPPGGVS